MPVICISNMSESRKERLTCIMDLSEYMSSMVLWIRFILPCRSGGMKIICNLLVSARCNITEGTGGRSRRRTPGVVFHFTPPTVQADLEHPQLFIGNVARGGVHGEVGG